MAKYFHSTRAPNTCGIGIISMFRKNTTPLGQPLSMFSNPGGCGWLVAGFVSDTASVDDHGEQARAQKESYEELKLKYQMMDQYPVRKNDNSGNKFFFVIYDTKSKLVPAARAEHNAQFKWPFA